MPPRNSALPKKSEKEKEKRIIPIIPYSLFQYGGERKFKGPKIISTMGWTKINGGEFF